MQTDTHRYTHADRCRQIKGDTDRCRQRRRRQMQTYKEDVDRCRQKQTDAGRYRQIETGRS